MSTRADIMAFIGANSRGFHDAMRRVRGDAKDTAQDAKKEFANLSAGMERSFNLLKTSIAGIGVGLSLQGAKQVISDVADIDRAAQRAGVSIKALQEMRYVAEKNRIDVQSMTDALRELGTRADEFATTGKGDAEEAFRRLGYSAKDVEQKLKAPSEMFADIIGRVRVLNKASQVRILDELFGGGAGERFVELIGQGEDGIRQTIEEAHMLGVIIEDDLVKRAAELDKEFNTVVTTVGTSLKQAVVSAASELRYMLDLLNNVENRTISTLEQQLSEKRDLLEKTNVSSAARFVVATIDGKGIERLEQEIATLEKLIETRKAAQIPPKPPSGTQIYDPVKPTDRSSSGRSNAVSEAERQKKAADQLIQALEVEYSVIGKSTTQQRIANDLRKLGAGATDEQKDRITSLITVIEAQKAAQERANKAQKDFIDGLDQMGSDAVDALGNVIAGTEDAVDAFKKLAIEIVKSALTGKGAYADFFSSIFGGSNNIGLGGMMAGFLGFGGQKSIAMNGGIGLYANGGVSDRPAIFGEAGPEAAVPLPDGRRIPVDLRLSDLPSASSSADGSTMVQFSPVYQIDARGADQSAVDRLQRGLEKTNREIEAKVVATFRKLGPNNIK